MNDDNSLGKKEKVSDILQSDPEAWKLGSATPLTTSQAVAGNLSASFFTWHAAYTLIGSKLHRQTVLQNLSPKFPIEDILAYPNFAFGPFATVIAELSAEALLDQSGIGCRRLYTFPMKAHQFIPAYTSVTTTTTWPWNMENKGFIVSKLWTCFPGVCKFTDLETANLDCIGASVPAAERDNAAVSSNLRYQEAFL
ncbi:hypothetical protein BTVI_39575 [Pitangus sulphuratus]|nr:hypothetical protein BTVI_39575 [Pitangus sulphuratus]